MGTKKHILRCHSILNINIEKASNTTLITSSGKEILDFESGIWCTALGHNNDLINKAIVDQLKKVSHLNTRFVSDIAEELAAMLTDIVGFNRGKTVFLSSGSEAVEMAVTLAKVSTKKNKLLSFKNSYLSAYSHMSMPRNNETWQEIDFTLCNSCCTKNCSSCSITNGIDFPNLAAFVFEPGNSGGRVLLPKSQLVEFLSNEVQKHGGKLVVNEVTTGFGRTGKWFGYNHYRITPDLIAMGKALGNGYPISATVMNKETANAIESLNFGYAQSHQNDPLGCRVGCEVIKVFKDQDIIKRSQDLGQFFIKQLKSIKSPLVKEIRGRGLMIALEFNKSGYAEKVFKQLFENGFYVGHVPSANILRFYPAITTKEGHIITLCETIKKILGNDYE